ncbi:tyrosine-protein kinase Etk/Wzc [Steroidobacter denitrificans]|uniref:Tyrosine-protein kinase Etk/Wzc n=1 Tax=Steroidobacter denitrificans TaxID=465721 RepID=A0A127FBA6_STEDE|nr:polysaccharide biosynthesis tyrosine autokinase [Steroidobacter denitrificans]AMN46921.1 tyrosine-protein kinase Etk/Wzc [Steroidobacter denitrificans]
MPKGTEPAAAAVYTDVNAAGDDVDLHRLLATLIEGRWIIVAAAIASLLIASVYLGLARPVYRANALVQVERGKSAFSAEFDNVAALFGQQAPEAAGEMELLRSRMVLGRAVDSLQMTVYAEPQYFPVIGRAMARRHAGEELAPPPFGLAEFAWGGEVIEVVHFEIPQRYIGRVFTLIAGEDGRYELIDPEGSRLLHAPVGKLARVALDDEELVLQIDVLHARPGTQFTLVSRSRQAVIGELQGRVRVIERGVRSGIIEITLEDTDRQQAADVVNEIAKQYLRQNVDRKSAEAAQRLAFLDEQLPAVRRDLQAAEDALNRYRNREGSVDLEREAASLLQQIVNVDQEITKLRQEREALIRRFTPAHPSIVTVDAQIHDLQVLAERLEQRVRGLPQTQQLILRRKRDVEVGTRLYTGMLDSYQQLQVIKAGTLGDVRIVDRAVAPLGIVEPNRPRTLMVALVLGLAGGVGFVFLARMLRGGISDPELIERYLGLPVYATVLHSQIQQKLRTRMRRRSERENYVLADADPQDPAVESLRNLRTALHFATLGADSNVLMITGPMSGVGKTFITMNLASVLAMSGKRVLMIDGDMRRGCLHEYVRRPRDPGLSELLGGAQALEQVIQTTNVDQLEIIASGVIPPAPAELLLHRRFAEMLADVSRNYDHVLIDTPPVLAVADAGIIGRFTGAALLVLQAERHPLRQIEHAARRLQLAGVNLRGVVLNDLRSATTAYGYGYGYGYRYDAK